MLGTALPAAGEDAHGGSADVASLGFETVSHGMGGSRGSLGVAGRKAVIPCPWGCPQKSLQWSRFLSTEGRRWGTDVFGGCHRGCLGW